MLAGLAPTVPSRLPSIAAVRILSKNDPRCVGQYQRSLCGQDLSTLLHPQCLGEAAPPSGVATAEDLGGAQANARELRHPGFALTKSFGQSPSLRLGLIFGP